MAGTGYHCCHIKRIVGASGSSIPTGMSNHRSFAIRSCLQAAPDGARCSGEFRTSVAPADVLTTPQLSQALTVSSDVSVDDACIVGLDACKAMGLAKTGDVVVVVHGQQEFPSVNDSTSLQLRTVP